MAALIEENFIEENLQPGTVFDFGCGNSRITKKVAQFHDTTAINLLEPNNSNGFKIIIGDILKTPILEKFDNVYAASSFEHVGLDFKYSKYYDFNADRKVAIILQDMIKDSGIFIITVPFGDNQLYVYNEKGESGSFEVISNPICGYRTFNLECIEELFFKLTIIKAKAYLKEWEKPDFANDNLNTWKEISLDQYKEVQPNHASLCVVMRRI